MLWSIRYGLLRWLLRLVVRCGLDELDLENAVLRHQLKILRRGGVKGAFIQIMPLTWDSFLLPVMDKNPWLTI